MFRENYRKESTVCDVRGCPSSRLPNRVARRNRIPAKTGMGGFSRGKSTARRIEGAGHSILEKE
jgi:hypothetical protein